MISPTFLVEHIGPGKKVGDDKRQRILLQHLQHLRVFYLALYNGSLNLPEDTYLPNTDKKCPYVITADDAFPLGCHVMKPFGGKYLEHQNASLTTDYLGLGVSVRIPLVYPQPDGVFLKGQ